MKPRSLIGPLLLIAIGALLLANTLQPRLPLLDILARYWPFLLIAWGALRLVEILIWRWRGMPLPEAGLSGAEWAAIVLICLVGSGLYAINQHRPWERLGVFTSKRIEVFGRAYDFPIPEQRHPALGVVHVVVENLRGDVRISGTDAAEVRASGRKTIRALQDTDAAQADRQSPLEVSVAGDRLIVRTNQDRVTGDNRVSVDLELSLPRSVSMEGRGREADFEIQDLAGPVEIASDNAGVQLRNIAGNVRLNLRRSSLIRAAGIKGSLDILGGRGRDVDIEDVQGPVTVEGFYSGDLRFRNLARPLRFQNAHTTLRVERLSGRIEMDLGRLAGAHLEGPLHFSTSRARDVELESFTGSAEISVESGDLTLRPASLPLGPIEAQTRTGDITLILPETAAFQLHAQAERGTVVNQFGPRIKEEALGERGAALKGELGRGPVIRLTTSRGSITIRKDSGESLTHPRPRRNTGLEVDADRGRLRIQRH